MGNKYRLLNSNIEFNSLDELLMSMNCKVAYHTNKKFWVLSEEVYQRMAHQLINKNNHIIIYISE